MKTCPDCKKQLEVKVQVCECGYDYTMDDCPGCSKRIPEGTMTCPHCNYNVLDGMMPPKPLPKAAPKPERQAETTKTATHSGHFTGERLCHVVVLGNFGQPEPNYPELYWNSKEVNDDTLYAWAQEFRRAYHEKVDMRRGCHLSNYAIADWCKHHATSHASRHDRKGRNDVLEVNADKIMELLGGDDNFWLKNMKLNIGQPLFS